MMEMINGIQMIIYVVILWDCIPFLKVLKIILEELIAIHKRDKNWQKKVLILFVQLAKKLNLYLKINY